MKQKPIKPKKIIIIKIFKILKFKIIKNINKNEILN